MNEPCSTIYRKVRVLAAPVMVATLLAASPVATAASSAATPAPSEASLKTQAQELAGQIEADGQNLDRMAEAFDAAQMRASRLSAQIATLDATMARTSKQVTTARTVLR